MNRDEDIRDTLQPSKSDKANAAGKRRSPGSFVKKESPDDFSYEGSTNGKDIGLDKKPQVAPWSMDADDAASGVTKEALVDSDDESYVLIDSPDDYE